MALSSTLTDTFDGTLQPKWNHSTPPAAGTSGGRAFLAAAHTGGTPAFNIIFSNGTYSFDVFSAQVFPAAANGAAGGTIVATELEINSATSGTRIAFLIDTVNNQLRAYNQVGATDAGLVTATYNATNHAYLRMRLSGNALLYETSANGFTWAVFRTVTPAPAWLGSEQIVPTLRTTRNSGTNNNAEFDNVNVVPSFPATSTLIDKFDSSPFNARWTAPAAPASQVVGGRAQVFASHTSGTPDRYHVVASSDCVFDSFSAQVFPPAVNGATAGFQVTAEIEVEHPTTLGKRVAMLIDAVSNLVYCYEQTNFVDPNPVVFAYDPAQHGFLRMRLNAGALLWETSPDGRTSTWTTRRTLNPVPAWLTSELVRPGLRATRTVGTNSYAEFDNVNFATPVTGGGTGTGGMGFNWPNTVVTFVNHWDQQSTTYANRAHPFAVAQTNGVKVMRTFFGTFDSFQQVKSPVQATRDQAWAGLTEMLDTAAAYGVRLVLSNYLTQESIGQLAGTTFPSWPAARQAVTTPNSPAWLGLQDWLSQVLSRFATHPGVFSWEVVNEPGYMLGIDDGSITRDQGCSFLNTFQVFLKNNGAQVVNAGGRVLFDKTALTDTQVITATQNVDWLDDHFYSDHANAATHLAAMDTWVSRVNTLLGRTMKVMIGEYGTDLPFFDDMTSGIVTRGWLPITWGWDAFDSNQFNDSTRTYVITKLNTVNAAATPDTDVTVTSRFQGIRVGQPGASVVAPASAVPAGWDEVRLYAPEGISGTVLGSGPYGTFDVRALGAVGNGTTDDTAAFTSAISLAVAAGGGVVYVPPGTYLVTSSLAAKDNVTIRGAGRGATTIRASAAVTTAMVLGSSGDTVSRFQLEGLTLDGRWATNAVTLAGVQITNGSEIVIRDCRFTNLGGAGVLLQGLGSGGGTPHSDVLNNVIDGAGLADGTTGMGIHIKDASTRCRVRGNDIQNVVGGMGIAGSGSGGTGFPTHLTISDNTVEMANGTTDFEAIGLASGCDYAEIADNNIPFSYDNGISYSAAYGSITGNVIGGSRNHGIAIVGAGTEVIGNTIRNPGQQNDAAYGGVSITSGGKCVVLGNSIIDDQGTPTMSHGVKLTTSAGTNFVGLNPISGHTVSPVTGLATGDLQLDITSNSGSSAGIATSRVYTDDLRVATAGQAGTINSDYRALARFWVGNTATSAGGQLNVFSNAGSTRPNACFNAVGSQTADLWQALASDISTVLARCTITGRLHGTDGLTTRDLGDITGLTSGQIDALFTATPVNGTVATAFRSGGPTVALRRGGTWEFAADYTNTAATVADFEERLNALTGVSNIGNVGSSLTVTPGGGNGSVKLITLTAATCTVTFNNPAVNTRKYVLEFVVTQDATGSRTITWPGSVKWVGGAPTLSTAGNAVDRFRFTTYNQGTTWYGDTLGKAYA